LIVAKYPTERSAEALKFEAAQMVPLLHPDVVPPGYMHEGRWRHIASTFADLGALPGDFSLQGFLYPVEQGRDLSFIWRWLIASALVLLLAGAVLLKFLRINRKLAQSLAKRELAEQVLSAFSAAVEQSPISVVITNLKAEIEYVNPRFTEVTGYTLADAFGKNPSLLNSGLTEAEVFADLWQHLSQGLPWVGEFVNRRKNGELFWEEAHIAPVFDGHGKPLRYLAMKLDITTRKEAERREQDVLAALRISEQRHRLLADHASDVIWTMDLQGKFTYVSPSVERLRGYRPEEVMRQSMPEALCAESIPVAMEGLGRAIRAVHAGETVPIWRGELEQPCKDGSTVWTDVTVTGIFDEAGNFVNLLGVTRDITERRRTEERVAHMARHDALTDLPNRLLFSERFEQELARTRREGGRLTLMFLDLDKFKPINDTYGHAVGDLVLQEAARRMKSSVRISDTVGRIGGDEFVVLVPSIRTPEEALQIAEKIRHALSQPIVLGELVLEISGSIGISLFPDHGNDPIALSKSADAAMYQAKQGGRNRSVLFSTLGALAGNPG